MSGGRARVVLADHQWWFRQGLHNQIAGAGYDVVGAVGDGDGLERCLIEAEPDIVVIDRYLPGVEVMTYIQALVALQPELQVLLLVGYEHEARALQVEALQCGAAGCLSKVLSPAAYISAIQQLAEGRLLYTADVVRRATRPRQVASSATLLSTLTDRERDVLQLVAEGYGNKEISEQLNISLNTTMKHVSNIITKLKVKNRREAGLLWLRGNL